MPYLRLPCGAAVPLPCPLGVPCARRRPASTAAAASAAAICPPAATAAPAKPFFVTTPIYYVNSKPHLGHLYSSLLADATARYARLAAPPGPSTATRRRVLFSTGTDEHGQKIQEAAAKAGVPPGAFCESVSASFRALHAAYAVSHDDFVRTSEPRHAAVVRWLWRRLAARGAIYLGSHSGWYCRSDEAFLTELQVAPRSEYLRKRAQSAKEAAVATAAAAEVSSAPPSPCSPVPASAGAPTDAGTAAALAAIDAELAAALAALSPEEADARVSTESGHPVEWLEEANYRFRLGAYREQLLAWVDGRLAPDGSVLAAETLAAAAPATTYAGPVRPAFRAAEVRGFVDAGLNDLSVSRLSDKVGWAIRVPGDDAHSVYVWLDALANYLTVAMAGGPYDPAAEAVTSSVTAGNGTAAAAASTQAQPPPFSGGELPDDAHWETLFPAWPADVHVVGKDILKFHAVYWPAFLIAAGLPPPRAVVAHGHWTVGRVKMSKSLGNVIDPMALLGCASGESGGDVAPAAAASSPSSPAAPAPVDTAALVRLCLSPDAVRYFLLREGSLGADGDVSADTLAVRAVGDCADVLGNLASRVLNGKLLPGGRLPVPGAVLPMAAAGSGAAPALVFTPEEAALAARLSSLRDAASAAYAAVNPGAALAAVMDCVCEANRVFSAAEPWKLAKAVAAAAAATSTTATAAAGGGGSGAAASDAAAALRLTSVVYLTLETLRVAAVLLQPAMPSKAPQLLGRMGFTPLPPPAHTPAAGSAAAAAPAPTDAAAVGGSWAGATFGAVPPSAYPPVDVTGPPLVLFAKPAAAPNAAAAATPPTSQAPPKQKKAAKAAAPKPAQVLA
jgi:methionyl-tRNA synthetase